MISFPVDLPQSSVVKPSGHRQVGDLIEQGPSGVRAAALGQCPLRGTGRGGNRRGNALQMEVFNGGKP